MRRAQRTLYLNGLTWSASLPGPNANMIKHLAAFQNPAIPLVLMSLRHRVQHFLIEINVDKSREHTVLGPERKSSTKIKGKKLHLDV